jgi:hypothetical protein
MEIRSRNICPAAVLSNFYETTILNPAELTISSPDLVSAKLDAWTYGPRRAAFSYDGRGSAVKGYLPSVSTFFFSSSFIFLTVGLRLLSPVV